MSIILTFVNIHSTQADVKCIQRLGGTEELYKTVEFRLTGYESSYRDLEPIFRRLVSGEPFELVIPRGYTFNLTPEVASVLGTVKHQEQDVNYYPYHLNEAKTKREQYYHDLLNFFFRELKTIQYLQQTHKPIKWLDILGMPYRFSPSPSTGANKRFFGHPERVVELIEIVKGIGKPPFTYKDSADNWYITSEPFLKHLRKRNLRSVTLYRAHNGFDMLFYRLLLSKKGEPAKLRVEFAEWLSKQHLSFFRLPNDTVWWTELIAQLKDQSQPIDPILLRIAQKTTTSVMFTSITNAYSSYWIAPNQDSEIIKLNLDLEKIPDAYLGEVFVGNDLDIEIAFPFTTLEQIQAMRAALTILP